MKNSPGDVIVIGGGISGLSASAYLSRKGTRVLLFERLNQLGGFVHNFKRGPYTFEATTHQISCCNHHLVGGHIFRLLGIKNVQPVKSDYLCELIHFNPQSGTINDRFLIPTGFDTIQKMLSDRFPDNSTEINRYFFLMKEIAEEVLRLRSVSREPLANPLETLLVLMFKNNNGIIKAIGKLRYPSIVNHFNECYANTIKFISNDDLHWILGTYSAYLGTDPSVLSTIVMFTLNYLYFSDGPYLIKGGTDNLVNELEQIIISNKGVIKKGSTIKKIIIKQGRVSGVETEDGEIFCADAVVSAINTQDTFGKLVSSDHIPADYLETIRSLDLTSSIFQIYLGLKDNPLHYGFKASTMFFDPSKNISDRHTLLNTTHDIEKRSETAFVLSNYSDRNLGLSTDGKSSVVIDEFMNMSDWMSLTKDEYSKRKETVTRIILEKVERVTGIPVRELTEVKCSATPKTMFNYSCAPGGSFIGPSYICSQVLSKRTQPVTPVRNLFLTGAYSSIAGVMGVLDSGLATANLVLRAL